jgi:hypothetical protein
MGITLGSQFPPQVPEVYSKVLSLLSTGLSGSESLCGGLLIFFDDLGVEAKEIGAPADLVAGEEV